MLVYQRVKDNMINMGVSENVVNPIVPNGFVWSLSRFEKWLFHWEYTIFSDKPTCLALGFSGTS